MDKSPSWPHPKLESTPEASEGSRHMDGNHQTHHVLLRKMNKLRVGERGHEMLQDSEIAQTCTVPVIPGTSCYFWGRIPGTGNLCWFFCLGDLLLSSSNPVQKAPRQVLVSQLWEHKMSQLSVQPWFLCLLWWNFHPMISNSFPLFSHVVGLTVQCYCFN